LEDRVPAVDSVLDAVGYAKLFRGEVDAWETTYVHQLPVAGDDHPVLRWFEGTGLRDVRSTVDDEGWAAFRGELNPRLEAAYPSRDGRVFFPFRRIFVVAYR
jgi:trans-aconitate 2-methyltransferase